MTAPAVRFETVCKRHPGGESLALDQLDVSVAAGEMVFVAGHSGAGKSTLLKLIALIERPSSGRVQILGQDLAQVGRKGVSAHRRTLGLVFQDHRLLTDRTVFDNVALPLVVGGWPHAEIVKRVRGALERVSLGHKERALPLALSGGEQQRVGIARALAARPALLLADEPTGNLDPELSAEIMQLFVDFQQAGTTVIVASHDLRLIQKLRKRVLVLKQGRLIDDFRPELHAAPPVAEVQA
jgi:cell division transport system ATP-binding protein